MKKTLLILTALTAASFAFAGGEACTDKSKCDDKSKDCACCSKDAKECKDAKAAGHKADDKAATNQEAKK